MKRASVIRLGILTALVALIVVVAVFVPIKESFESGVAQVRTLGPWGPVAITTLFILACVLMLPTTPVSLATGMLFGFWMGLLTLCIGGLVGPALAYLAGRNLARGWVKAAVARRPTLRAVDCAVADNGFKIIFLARLSPFMPLGIMNYVFSLTRVSFGVYLAATFLGLMPCALAYAYLGSLAANLTELLSGESGGGITRAVLLYGGIAVTVLVSVYVARVAGCALKGALARAATGPSTEAVEEAELPSANVVALTTNLAPVELSEARAVV